jgi:hypothetical protein
MSYLATASMESYSRCYPALIHLHILSELEQGCSFITDSHIDQDIMELWDHRIAVVSPSFKERAKILSVRRAILASVQNLSGVGKYWLDASKLLRQKGRYDSSMIALRLSEVNGLRTNEILIEECHILKETGKLREALLLLEPDSIILSKIKQFSSQPKRATAVELSGYSIEEAAALAHRLLLATSWMQENRLCYGREILERYHAVLCLNKNWETGLFHLARFVLVLVQIFTMI